MDAVIIVEATLMILKEIKWLECSKR
jgi:hypothetical protein